MVCETLPQIDTAMPSQNVHAEHRGRLDRCLALNRKQAALLASSLTIVEIPQEPGCQPSKVLLDTNDHGWQIAATTGVEQSAAAAGATPPATTPDHVVLRCWPVGRYGSGCGDCQACAACVHTGEPGGNSGGGSLSSGSGREVCPRQQLEADAMTAVEEAACLRQQLFSLLAQQQEEREAAAAEAAALRVQVEEQRRRAELAEAEVARVRQLSQPAVAYEVLAVAEAAQKLAEARLAAEQQRTARLQQQVARQQGVIAALAESRGEAFEERFHLRQELNRCQNANEQAHRAVANLKEALAQQRQGAEKAGAAAREDFDREATARWQARVLELRKQLAEARRKMQQAQKGEVAAQADAAEKDQLLRTALADLTADHAVLLQAQGTLAAELTALRRRDQLMQHPENGDLSSSTGPECGAQSMQHPEDGDLSSSTSSSGGGCNGGSCRVEGEDSGPPSPSPCGDGAASGARQRKAAGIAAAAVEAAAAEAGSASPASPSSNGSNGSTAVAS